jgi:transcriptional regulator with XRE-family HTH domain
MRKDKGMTQKHLAEQIGVNIRWVQKLEAGDTKLENITFLNAIKLIRALTPYDDENQLAQEMYIMIKRTLQENA